MAHILVTGATGKQGGEVAAQLLERGHEVTAYVRTPESPAAQALASNGARLATGDLADAEALAAAAKGTDGIFGLTVPFGEGGKDEEVAAGKILVDAAAAHGGHFVYSSVRGADKLVESNMDHADSKQIIEAYLGGREVPATVLGPVYFMENALNVGFNRLKEGAFSTPLSPGKPLDQVTVKDIAGMAVHAFENPVEMIGRRVDIASDRVSGEEVARILGGIFGKDLPYQVFPIAQIRQWAGEEIATMFEAFEANTDFIDLDSLHAAYPQVRWHSFEDWARTVDWDRVLAKG